MTQAYRHIRRRPRQGDDVDEREAGLNAVRQDEFAPHGSWRHLLEREEERRPRKVETELQVIQLQA